MLQIDYDIKDAQITSPGMSMLDPAASFAPVIKALGSGSAYLLPPSNNALMITPIQLLPGWTSATKFQPGDYGAPSAWEGQQIRASGDWFMHSSGAVTALALSYTFPANVGWFIEFRAYAQPKSLPGPIFDFYFGGHFQVFVNNNGRIDLYDLNTVDTGQPIASGNIANFSSFVNEDVQLLILPFRRSQILVWSPNKGGYLDAEVVVGKDGNITEPCAPSVYNSVAPPAALVAITPLLYPADGLPSIAAPAKGLSLPLTQTPTFNGSVYDQPANTNFVLTAITTFEDDPTAASFFYEVTMQGNPAHQTAEEQGVTGISSAATGPPATSGDSVFSGGEFPYSLYTPFHYLAVIGYARGLGPTEYTNNTLTGILSAKLVLSKDRSSKSFTFTIDNPANVTGDGANYTSLKDLQNRRTRAYITTPSLEAGGFSTSDLDPDTPLIGLYGGNRIYIFDGFGDQPEFVDGVNSRLQIRCQGLRKRLRNYLFDDPGDRPIYDGMLHTAVVTDVLQRCGFVGPTDTETTGLGCEIVCEASTVTLPKATPGTEPLFTPALGTNAEDFLNLIIKYTGWVLDDLFVIGATNATWYWVSPGYFASNVYAAQGSPTIYLGSRYESGVGGEYSLPDQTKPNSGLGSISMLSESPPRQSLEELIANNIFVVGVGSQNQVIVAHARDEASISNRSAVNYVGEVRTYILASQSINTQEAANQVCALLYTDLRQARTHLTFDVPDYYPMLGIAAPASPDGYWDGVIDGVEVDFSKIRTRKSTISVLRNSS